MKLYAIRRYDSVSYCHDMLISTHNKKYPGCATSGRVVTRTGKPRF